MVYYRSLNTQKSEIRLVTLLPGKPCDGIRCTLSTVSLNSPPNFSALSYVWGDPSKTKSIIVDGEPFDVTVNLEAGLRALRKRWKPRVLWIDAICINQEDPPEKNVQVPQMGRLYSTAPAVLVWLGPSTPDMEFALSWFRAHISKTSGYTTASAYWLMVNMTGRLSKRGQHRETMALLRATNGLLDFLALPYWGRMWTFQEYILPRTTPLCLFGNMQPFKFTHGFMKMDHINLLLRLFREASKRFEADRWNMIPEESAIVVEKNRSLGSRVLSWKTMKELCELEQLDHWRAKHKEGPSLGMMGALLVTTADRHCYDARDKVYALYGMVPAAQDMCPPDYTENFSDVMLKVVTYIVNVEQHPSLIWPCFGLREDRLSNEVLVCPSWMPDFTKERLPDGAATSPHVCAETEVYADLRRRGSRPVVIIGHTTLQLWARSLGICKVLLNFAQTTLNIIEQIIGLLQRDGLGGSFAKMAGRFDTLDSRILRTCVAHSVLSAGLSTEQILGIFQKIISPGVDDLIDPIHESSCRRAVDGLRGKALLVTEEGGFGISVGGAKDGDIVVISPDVEVPLVLTPELTNSAHGNYYYKMVGTAIMNGIMAGGNGEMFDKQYVEEIAKRGLLEFLVH